MLNLMLAILLILFSTTSATITNAELISDNGQTHLRLLIQPQSPISQISLSPEEAQTFSNNLFSLEQPINFNLEISNWLYLYEISGTNTESIYTSDLQVWCGATFSTCNNCGNMPPGTYKWCNGMYPLKTYDCDNWCYTYSLQPTYEKSRPEKFSHMFATGKLAPTSSPQISIVFNSTSNSSTENLNIEIISSETTPPPTPDAVLFKSTSNNKWQQLPEMDYQTYKNAQIIYNSQYALSHESAHSATRTLGAAFETLRSNAFGEFSPYFYIESETLPQIKLTLNSDYAGVVMLRGIPKILSLSETATIEGESAYYSATLQNQGQTSDSFSLNLSCESQTVTSNVLLESDELATLPLFMRQLTEEENCSLLAFVTEEPSIRDEFSATLQPFQLPCPAELQCCNNSSNYFEKTCINEERFVQEDGYGNGYYYLQHFACQDFHCMPSSTTFLRRTTGNTPPQTISFYTPPQQAPPATSPSPAKNPSPTTAPPNPTPSPSPLPQLERVEINAPDIEIFIPDVIEEGYNTVEVREDFSPAEGILELVSPSNNRLSFMLENGKAEALFNEEGKWELRFSEKTKTINVLSNSAPPGTTPPPSRQTSFLSLGFSNMPLFETALILLAVVLGYGRYNRHLKRLRFKKSVENNIVRLEIINPKTDLKELEITDIVPEGTILSTISNPPSEVTEIIFGKHIKWKKGELKKGERMLISYSIFSENKNLPLRSAELTAIEGNKRIQLLSNSITL